MANLDAAADKAVHDAVDAFMQGRLTPEFSGETVFETKHSRYRLRDGVVYAAPTDALIGAELVGWLMETPRRAIVESAWQPGSRAVLVDRTRGRNIIVTSSTRLLHLEEAVHLLTTPISRTPVDTRPLPASPTHPTPKPPAQPERSGFSVKAAPILAATPLPPPVATAPVPAIPAAAPVPAKRATGVHLPPRPIAASRHPVTPIPGEAPESGPLRRANPAQRPAASAPPAHPEPVQDTPWELTSSEIELDPEGDDVETTVARVPDAPESSGGAPIPLVRPIEAPRPRR